MAKILLVEDNEMNRDMLSRRLAREGYDAKVCVLPKSWRNEKGKADWDGRLAFHCGGLKSEGVKVSGGTVEVRPPN